MKIEFSRKDSILHESASGQLLLAIYFKVYQLRILQFLNLTNYVLSHTYISSVIFEYMGTINFFFNMLTRYIIYLFALLYVASVCYGAETVHMFTNDRCEGESSHVDVVQGDAGHSCTSVGATDVKFNVHKNDKGVVLTEYSDDLCQESAKETVLNENECVRLADDVSVKAASAENSSKSHHTNIGLVAVIALVSLGFAMF